MTDTITPIGTHQRAKGALGVNALSVLALGMREGGVTNAEVARLLGLKLNHASGRITNLVRGGHMVKVEGKAWGCKRYFSIPRDDIDLAALPLPVVPPPISKPPTPPKERAVKVLKPKPARVKITVTEEPRKAAKKQGNPAPVLIKAKPNTKPTAEREVIVPDTAIFTRCPSPAFDARFQIDPATRVVGGFATMGIGRYLDA